MASVQKLSRKSSEHFAILLAIDMFMCFTRKLSSFVPVATT